MNGIIQIDKESECRKIIIDDWNQTILFEFLWVLGLDLVFVFFGFLGLGRDPNPKPKFFWGKTSDCNII